MDTPVKTRIILAKPSSERATDRRSTPEFSKSGTSKGSLAFSDSRAPESSSAPPTRILKSKDSIRTSSPGPQTTPATTPTFALPSLSISSSSRDLTANEDVISSTAKIQIQKSVSHSTNSALAATTSQNEKLQGNTLEARLMAYPEMKGCVKLVDESLQWCDQTSEFLQDQSDFLVVGILGLQGSGKSTVMSHLYGNRSVKNPKQYVFKTQSKEQRDIGEHCTRGVDILITDQRMILLDVQPVLSASIMDHLIQFEKKFPAEYNSTENALEIQSLQTAAFLFTVCHTIIIIQDWFTDPNLLKFIQTAEMLRPSALLPKPDGGSDESTEYCPNIVFVHNKCTLGDFEPAKIKLIQDVYSKIFQRSKLKFKGEVGITSGTVIPSLCEKTCGEPINLFLLPLIEERNQSKGISEDFREYRGHQGFDQLMNNLREQIISMSRSNMLPTTLTEKNWSNHFDVNSIQEKLHYGYTVYPLKIDMTSLVGAVTSLVMVFTSFDVIERVVDPENQYWGVEKL